MYGGGGVDADSLDSRRAPPDDVLPPGRQTPASISCFRGARFWTPCTTPREERLVSTGSGGRDDVSLVPGQAKARGSSWVKLVVEVAPYTACIEELL